MKRGLKMNVITLCGSTKFKEEFEKTNKELTLKGNVVFSVALYGHKGDIITNEQKVLLDQVHRWKIDLSDGIFVINKGGYIGESTKKEIEYATIKGLWVCYLEEKEG
jgi:hypothetical protein